jgi:hypothetical protein
VSPGFIAAFMRRAVQFDQNQFAKTGKAQVLMALGDAVASAQATPEAQGGSVLDAYQTITALREAVRTLNQDPPVVTPTWGDTPPWSEVVTRVMALATQVERRYYSGDNADDIVAKAAVQDASEGVRDQVASVGRWVRTYVDIVSGGPGLLAGC